MRAWFRAYGLYTGGVIGVGIFGLPAALVRSGLLVFIAHLTVVGLLAWWIQRCFIAVVARTRGRHRLPGYARMYVGSLGAGVAAVANVLGLIGALVAYLLAGGTFVRLLLEPVLPISALAATLVYFLPGALLLTVGLRALPALELVILLFFLLVLGILPPAAWDHLRPAGLPLIGDPAARLLPYGVLLFAFWGVSLIPETVELARRSERRAALVVSMGLLTAAIAYLVFAVLIASITGSRTTEDALAGLRSVLGDGVVFLTLVFGVLTTFSSYLALGLTLLRTLTLDYRLARTAAWALVTLLPLALVVGGFRSLLFVLSVTGAVFLGTEGMVVLAMRRKLDRTRVPARRAAALASSVALLAAGVLIEVWRSVR